MVFITFSFMASFHNLDNAWNLNIVENYYDDDWCDIDLFFGECWDASDIYPIAVGGMLLSFASLLVFSIVSQVKVRRVALHENKKKH